MKIPWEFRCEMIALSLAHEESADTVSTASLMRQLSRSGGEEAIDELIGIQRELLMLGYVTLGKIENAAHQGAEWEVVTGLTDLGLKYLQEFPPTEEELGYFKPRH